jgi:hypothetical protein
MPRDLETLTLDDSGVTQDIIPGIPGCPPVIAKRTRASPGVAGNREVCPPSERILDNIGQGLVNRWVTKSGDHAMKQRFIWRSDRFAKLFLGHGFSIGIGRTHSFIFP